MSFGVESYTAPGTDTEHPGPAACPGAPPQWCDLPTQPGVKPPHFKQNLHHFKQSLHHFKQNLQHFKSKFIILNGIPDF